MNEQIELIKNQILNAPANSRGRRVYSEDLKASVRNLRDQGMSLKAIAEGTGIHVTTLYCWFPQAKKTQVRGFKEIRIAPTAEVARTVEIHFESGVSVIGLCTVDLIQLLKQELLR